MTTTNEARIVIGYPGGVREDLRIHHDAFVEAVRNGGALCDDLSDLFTVRILTKPNGEVWGFVDFA